MFIPGDPTSMLVSEKRLSPESADGEIGGEPLMFAGGGLRTPACLSLYHQWAALNDSFKILEN